MRWEELTWPQIDALDRDRTILVLPLGSVEQHGRHMPVGTDTMLATAVALAAAERQAGAVVVLPPPWYGMSTHHMCFAGSISLSAATMLALVGEIAAGPIGHGFRRLLVLNGHGGNSGIVAVLAAELGHRFYGRARIGCLTYFQLAREAIASLRRSKAGGMGHACEFETSMMLHLRPELVAPEAAETTYPETGSPYLTTDLIGGSPVNAYQDFADLSSSGTLGDPSLADAAHGAEMFAAVIDALVQFMDDFRQWPLPEAPVAER